LYGGPFGLLVTDHYALAVDCSMNAVVSHAAGTKDENELCSWWSGFDEMAGDPG
jgi:hypothetical protein